MNFYIQIRLLVFNYYNLLFNIEIIMNFGVTCHLQYVSMEVLL